MDRHVTGWMAFLAVGLVAAAAPAPPPEVHVRGDVVALDGDTLRVKPRAGGEQTLKLAGDAHISVATRADASAIAQGGFVGTTAVPGRGGALRALEVHVFPEAMRGAGEGHRPWDLRAGSSMTNATVSTVAGAGSARSTMTNATVQRAAKAGGGLKLSLKYKDGEKTVLVPPGTPVVKLEPADRARLVPGAHVFAAGPRQADGTVLVERAVVGEGDVRPPM